MRSKIDTRKYKQINKRYYISIKTKVGLTKMKQDQGATANLNTEENQTKLTSCIALKN